MIATQARAGGIYRGATAAAVAGLRERLARAAGGGEVAQARQRSCGRRSVRGRIGRVLDPDPLVFCYGVRSGNRASTGWVAFWRRYSRIRPSGHSGTT